LTVDAATVEALAFKPAEDRPGWYALRLQEIAGKPAARVEVSIEGGVSEAVFANLAEEPTGEPADLSRLELSPWQTLTILVQPASGEGRRN
jgi:hypothetical protein